MDHRRPPLQATLALTPDVDGEAPVGALITPDGQRHPFSGWIELASAIEDWRSAHERPAQTQTTERSDLI